MNLLSLLRFLCVSSVCSQIHRNYRILVLIIRRTDSRHIIPDTLTIMSTEDRL